MSLPKVKYSITDEIRRLLNADPVNHAQYYQLSLFADENGKFHYSMTSAWVGFTTEGPRREIRQPSLINSNGAISLFKSIGEPVFVINTKKDLEFFMLLVGGHSIIRKTLADKYLSHLLKPDVFAYSFDDGFVNVKSLPKEKFHRAAAPKLRMKILDRDKRRCKICGSRPENNEHVELHLHHIIPYSAGGLTDENNLITLCHTCHKGIGDRTDYSLFASIDVGLLSKRLIKNSYENKLQWNLKSNLLRANQKPAATKRGSTKLK